MGFTTTEPGGELHSGRALHGDLNYADVEWSDGDGGLMFVIDVEPDPPVRLFVPSRPPVAV
jgi:hypothetical protein